MPGSPGKGERAYAYAKACGIIGKSCIGKRIAGLESVSRLSELDRAIFPSSSQNLPEKELLPNLENRIIQRSVKSIISIVDSFSKVPELLSLLIRSYEYADLKSAITASLEGDKKVPSHTDIGVFQTVHFDKWPDIQAMIKGTEFSFLLTKKGVLQSGPGGVSLHTSLDRHYYGALWKSLKSLGRADRRAAEKILLDEISLKNAMWALRLRTYYRMSQEQIKVYLIDRPVKTFSWNRQTRRGKFQDPAGQNRNQAPLLFQGIVKFRSLASDAVRSLEFPLDSYSAWSSWRWAKFLNPETGGGLWKADPRYFQNAASRYLYRLARRNFRSSPFSLGTIFCYIKLKQYEEDILTSGAEGLGMGMSGKEIFSALGVQQ